MRPGTAVVVTLGGAASAAVDPGDRGVAPADAHPTTTAATAINATAAASTPCTRPRTEEAPS
ncbi:hypothetical protein GCM10023204_17310 [Actinomycetospora succinea]